MFAEGDEEKEQDTHVKEAGGSVASKHSCIWIYLSDAWSFNHQTCLRTVGQLTYAEDFFS